MVEWGKGLWVFIYNKNFIWKKKIIVEIYNMIIISKCLVDLFVGWFYVWKYFDLLWYFIIIKFKKKIMVVLRNFYVIMVV